MKYNKKDRKTELEKLIIKKAKLLDAYNSLVMELLRFDRDIDKFMADDSIDVEQKFSWNNHIRCNDDEFAKIDRLYASLLYVEYPGNEDIITALEDNIEMSRYDRKMAKIRKKS